MVKLKDIAEQAGVSIGAVSRVLSGDPSISVSPQTREEISRIANELGYTARSKPTKTIKKLAIFLLYEEKSEVDDPYYLTIRVNINEQAKKSGFETVVHFGGISRSIRYSDYAGILIVGSRAAWKREYAAIIEALDIPAIFVDFRPDSPKCDYIISDFRDIMENCLRHLIKTGYKKIGYLGQLEQSEKNAIIDVRQDAFRDILTRHGLYEPKYMFLHKMSVSDTNVGTGYLLAERSFAAGCMPEVFFVENDSMAIGAINSLNKLGIKVPDDVGVIGCNDNPTSSFLNPPLTTVKIYNDLMGRLAVQRLVGRIEGSDYPGIGTIVPNRLIVRKTLKSAK